MATARRRYRRRITRLSTIVRTMLIVRRCMRIRAITAGPIAAIGIVRSVGTADCAPAIDQRFYEGPRNAGLCFFNDRFRSSRRARSDVERKRCGVGHVEALDFARQLEPRQAIAGLSGQLAKPFAFSAEHQRQRRPQRNGGEIVLRARVRAPR